MPAPLKTDMSTKQRQRWSRRRGRDDDGQALIIVLILAVALITMVTFAVSSSVANLNSSANYANSSQAQLTAYSGLSYATSAMTAVGTTIPMLPCPSAAHPITGTMPLPKTAGGYATYSVTINYYSDSAATALLACNGTGNTFSTGNTPTGVPVSAILTSTGTSPKTTPVTMQETVSVSTPQLFPAFQFAMFSPGTVDLTASVAVNQIPAGQYPGQTTAGPSPDVSGGTFSECTDGTVLEGNVFSYSSIDVNSSCIIDGNLYVQGDVSFSRSVHIKGNVYAYGGSVSLTGKPASSAPTIDGSIYAIADAKSGVGGTITANTNYPTIHGSLYATGAITYISNATIGILPVTPNDTAIASWTMPAQAAFPPLMPGPAAADITSLQNAGYTVYQVPGPLYLTCDALFSTSTTLLSLIDSLGSTKTAIYAPTCTPKMTGLGIATPYIVSTDMIWVLGGFEANGTTVFTLPLTASPGTTYNLSIIVPYTHGGTSCKKGGGITFTNSTKFDSRINVLLYTPCTANFTVSPSMNGQILAQKGITGTNNFTLNFDYLAAFGVPGTSSSLAAVAVQSKTVSSG